MAEQRCEWKYDDIDNCYETACRHAYCLIEGTLADNDHHYCPYCGGKIKQVKKWKNQPSLPTKTT